MKRRVVKASVIAIVLAATIVPLLLRGVNFGHPFSVLKADRKLTKQELIRAMRMMVAAEYEAVQMYTQLAESIDDELAQKVLLDVANEERVHAGEFLRVLKHLDPEEEKFYQEGYKEVEQEMEQLKEEKQNTMPQEK